MGSTDDVEVTRYYKDRQMWVVDVDRDVVQLSRYQPGAEPLGRESQD
jgi:spermidine synthase